MTTKDCIIDTLCQIQKVNLTERTQRQIVAAIMYAYAKHVLDKEDVGWDELGDILLNALCEAIGDDGYGRWSKDMRSVP